MYFQVYGPYETSMMLQWSKAVSVTKPYMKYEIWLIKVLQDTMLQYSMRSRLDYQPLFGKGARASPPDADRTRESGGNRAYMRSQATVCCSPGRSPSLR